MIEEWKKLPSNSNYSVSNTGKIRNDKSGEEKKPQKHDGYLDVTLYEDGKPKHKRVHRAVAEAFIENPNNYSEVNHIDGNKLNNSVSNLEWASKSMNMRHAFETGLCKPSMSMLGRSNPNAGRKGIPIRIVETGEEFDSIVECEKAIDGNNRHICDCLSGRQQTHRGYHFEYV